MPECGIKLFEMARAITELQYESKPPSVRPKKPTKTGEVGAKKEDRPEPGTSANPAARKAGKAKKQVGESATPRHTQGEDTKEAPGQQAEGLPSFGSGLRDTSRAIATYS